MYFVGASYARPILFFTFVLGSFIFVWSKLVSFCQGKIILAGLAERNLVDVNQLKVV